MTIKVTYCKNNNVSKLLTNNLCHIAHLFYIWAPVPEELSARPCSGAWTRAVLRRGGKSTKILYSSKSTITLLKFYLSTSKSTSLKIYSSKSKK